MEEFLVVSVNTSDKKGVIKHPAISINLNQLGIIGDAHAGKWHRQISLLAQESIEKAEKITGVKFPPGTFAENITTSGIALHNTSIGDRFENESVILEVTQLGKKCHAKCNIGKMIGNCIMPIEGIFCKVIKGGTIIPKDKLAWIKQ
jgi:MOSC domain-containing protein YiiM